MKQGKFFTGIIIGAAVGAAISYLFTSGKGKELVDKLKTATGNAEEATQNDIATAETELENLLHQGKEWLQNKTNG